MPERGEEIGMPAGVSAAEPVDVAALFESLREEVRRSGGDAGAGHGEAGDRRAPPAQADRLWPLSARRTRRSRASLARVGRPRPAPAAGLARRDRHSGQVGAPQGDALVRRAARLRPAVVQRRDATPGRRSTGPHRRARARARGGTRRVAPLKIAVCRPQVPFTYGGAEIFSDTLVTELRGRGHEAEIVSVPFKWYPGTRVLTQAFLWRLLDLTETDGRPIDMVVATKFPSYAIRHPEK